jgi:hypothetical protein
MGEPLSSEQRGVNGIGAGLLSLGIIVALLLGSLTSGSVISLPVITACLAVATALTIGGLRADWHSRANMAISGRLLVVNLVAGSLVVAAMAWMVGLDTPAGKGFLALAVVPVAAGLPAYASAVGISPERVSLFALVSYAGALIATPLLLSLVFGTESPWRPVVLTVLAGLVLPAIIGVALARWIKRLPHATRRGVSILALLVAMVGLGKVLTLSDITTDALGAPAAAIVALSLLRAPLGGLLGVGLYRSSTRRPTPSEAALAGGYKNCAMAGATAIAAGIPAAAVPSALGLLSEAILLGAVALLRRRSPTADVIDTTPERKPT